ncbi:hypothetical protein MBLNU459_g6372t2 [Dothideomycetes sp. NU459]
MGYAAQDDELFKEEQSLPFIEKEDSDMRENQDKGDTKECYNLPPLKTLLLGLILAILLFTSLALVIFGTTLYTAVNQFHQAPSEFKPHSMGNEIASQGPALHKPGSFICGTTADEARALGCKWDIMTMSWEHPDCFDADLTREFEELGPWQFYHSSRPGKEVPEPGMLTPIPYELVKRGWKMGGELASFHHTEHCSQALSNTSVPMDAIITKTNVQFPTC